MFVTIPSGPVPNDDFISVVVTDHSTGFNAGVGFSIKLTHGSLLVIPTIGWDEIRNEVSAGSVGFAAAGVAVDAQAFQYHANGTLVDSSAVVAYGVWDQSQAWALMHFLGGTTGSLAAVLAAVRGDFPATA